MELWFERSSGNGKIGSLRDIPRDEVDAMLDVARCKILHSKHDDKIDSYVLRYTIDPITSSESPPTMVSSKNCDSSYSIPIKKNDFQ